MQPLAEILQSCAATRQPDGVAGLLEVQLFVPPRSDIGQNLFNDIVKSNNSLRAAKLINYDRKSLGMSKKCSKEVERAHGFRDEGWRFEVFRVMLPRIQQEALHLQNAQNLVRAISKDRHPAVPLDAELADRFFIGQSIRNRKCVDAGGHAVLYRLIT